MAWLNNPQAIPGSMPPAALGQHATTPLPEDPLLIDVRSYAEFMSGHLPGAHSLPLSHLEDEVSHKLPDRDAPVVVYCSTGARAEQALGLLQRMGYRNAHNGGGAHQLAQRLHQPLQGGL